MNETRIPVVVIDDHRLFSQSFALALAADRRFSVVAVCETVDAGLEAVKTHHPALVVADIEMKGRGVFDMVDAFRRVTPTPRIVLLTAHENDALLEQAARRRFDGYLLKTDPLDGVVESLVEAASGRVVCSPGVRDRLDNDDSGALAMRSPTGVSSLSARQIDVLRHLTRGHSVKEIAKIMHLSAKTIETHKYRIMKTLDIHDRVQLARFAMAAGIETGEVAASSVETTD